MLVLVEGINNFWVTEQAESENKKKYFLIKMIVYSLLSSFLLTVLTRKLLVSFLAPTSNHPMKDDGQIVCVTSH